MRDPWRITAERARITLTTSSLVATGHEVAASAAGPFGERPAVERASSAFASLPPSFRLSARADWITVSERVAAVLGDVLYERT
jgi:hypothetical protein